MHRLRLELPQGPPPPLRVRWPRLSGQGARLQFSFLTSTGKGDLIYFTRGLSSHPHPRPCAPAPADPIEDNSVLEKYLHATPLCAKGCEAHSAFQSVTLQEEPAVLVREGKWRSQSDLCLGLFHSRTCLIWAHWTLPVGRADKR